MQANVDAAQTKYNEAGNRVSELQAKLDNKLEVLKALEALGDEELVKTVKQQIRQLQNEIVGAKAYVDHCETELDEFQRRLKSQERRVNDCESSAENYKARIDQFIAWRDALLDNLEKAKAAYDDACKAYEEAKAAADKAASPEITQPTETTPPLRLGATGRDGTARQLTRNRQRRSTELRQASEHKQRQASKYDRRQARKHRRHNAKRNRTRRNRRHGTRNNRHSHPPYQELKIAADERHLRQSTNPNPKEARFPNQNQGNGPL